MNYPTYMVFNIFFNKERTDNLIIEYTTQLINEGYTKEEIMERVGNKLFITELKDDYFKMEFDNYIQENVDLSTMDNLISILVNHTFNSIDFYQIVKKSLKNYDTIFFEKIIDSLI